MRFLTFDIEDWFHILDNPETKFPHQWEKFPGRVNFGLDIILDICDKHDIKATFFCLGWIAKKYPHLILKIHQKGHKVGTHGFSHQLVYEQTPGEFREDLLASIATIESITKTTVDAYRAPGFSITKDCLWAFDVIAECGIKYDSSVFPAQRAHGGLKEAPIAQPFLLRTTNNNTLIELPINTKKLFGQIPIVFGGGGYFRLMPYFLLKKWFLQETYVMTYFHPRDFDDKQPKIPGLNIYRSFKAFYGLSRTRRKLNQILALSDFNHNLENARPKEIFDLTSIS